MASNLELMKSVPVRIVDWYHDEDTKRIVLKRPKFYSDWAKRIFGPFLKHDYYQVKLDDLGTAVWQNCDGKNDVRKLGEILAAKFGPDIEPIYDRLSKFIIQLHKAKLIELRRWS